MKFDNLVMLPHNSPCVSYTVFHGSLVGNSCIRLKVVHQVLQRFAHCISLILFKTMELPLMLLEDLDLEEDRELCLPILLIW